LQGGKSAAQIARELGISTQSLKHWKKQLAALPVTGPGQRSVEQLEEENRRLKREIHRLAQQRDILKKTLGIISTPNDDGLSA
jgi:transposase